jgi:ABC-type branched-subunit amino acid transport system substrate-binding protein
VQQDLSRADLTALAEQYVATYPGDLILRQLAQDYRQAGDAKAEAAVWRRFVAVFPTHPETPSALNRLQELETMLRPDRTKLGVILPLVGDGNRAGKRALWALQLALQVLHTRDPSLDLSIVIRDEGDSAEEATAALRSLVSEARVIGVIGPLFSQTAHDLAPLASELEVPVISPYARDSDFPLRSPYAFRNSLTDTMQAQFLARYAVQHLNRRRLAILYPSDAYGMTLKDLFSAEVKRLQGHIVATSSYAPDTTDFQPALARLHQGDYEALFIPDYAENISRLAPYLAAESARGVQLLGADGWDAPELTSIENNALDGALFVDGFFIGAQAPEVKFFVTQFRNHYGEAPDLLAAQAYDTLLMCAEILRSGVTTRAQLQDSLLHVYHFPGVSGATSMDADGDAEKTPYLLTIQRGEIVQVNVPPGL